MNNSPHRCLFWKPVVQGSLKGTVTEVVAGTGMMHRRGGVMHGSGEMMGQCPNIAAMRTTTMTACLSTLRPKSFWKLSLSLSLKTPHTPSGYFPALQWPAFDRREPYARDYRREEYREDFRRDAPYNIRREDARLGDYHMGAALLMMASVG